MAYRRCEIKPCLLTKQASQLSKNVRGAVAVIIGEHFAKPFTGIAAQQRSEHGAEAAGADAAVLFGTAEQGHQTGGYCRKDVAYLQVGDAAFLGQTGEDGRLVVAEDMAHDFRAIGEVGVFQHGGYVIGVSGMVRKSIIQRSGTILGGDILLHAFQQQRKGIADHRRYLIGPKVEFLLISLTELLSERAPKMLLMFIFDLN